MNKITAAVVFLCLAIFSPTLGLVSKTDAATPSSVANEESQKNKANVFRGIVKKLDGGTALFTEKTIYPLIGGDFQTIVGKEVYIIGKIVTEQDVEKIMVSRIQFDKN